MTSSHVVGPVPEEPQLSSSNRNQIWSATPSNALALSTASVTKDNQSSGTLIRFRSLQRLNIEKRPPLSTTVSTCTCDLSGLPNPTPLHLQVFSTSWCLNSSRRPPALFHAGITLGIVTFEGFPCRVAVPAFHSFCCFPWPFPLPVTH